MPYSIRKQKCKQSDGDSGSYTLSYTDKKGKGHSACHTSRKKAQGQIAAIEGPYEGDELTGEDSLREAIRYLLDEKNDKPKNDKKPAGNVSSLPANLQVDRESSPPPVFKAPLFTWNTALSKANEANEANAITLIQDIISKGPKKANEHGEDAVVAALNLFKQGSAVRQPTGTKFDILLNASVTFGDTTLEPGEYEAKSVEVAKDQAMARLGSEKATSVSAQPPLVALVSVGREYASVIANRDFNVDDNITPAGIAYKALQDYFEGKFPEAKTNGLLRYQSMAALTISSSTIDVMKAGTFATEIQKIITALRDADLIGVSRPNQDNEVPSVTLTANVPGSGDAPEKTYEFDPEAWDLQVQPYLSKKSKNASAAETDTDDDMLKLRQALKRILAVLLEAQPELDKLSGDKYWDELANTTQTKKKSNFKGIFAISQYDVTIYQYNELTVKAILDMGRLVLRPKLSESKPAATLTSGFMRSHTLSALIREVVNDYSSIRRHPQRHTYMEHSSHRSTAMRDRALRILLEELTAADKREIEKIARKQSERTLSQALGPDIMKTIRDEVEKVTGKTLASKDSKAQIEELVVAVVKSLYKDITAGR